MVEKMPVRIGKDILEELKKMKLHPRETYDDVIRRIVQEWKSMKSK